MELDGIGVPFCLSFPRLKMASGFETDVVGDASLLERVLGSFEAKFSYMESPGEHIHSQNLINPRSPQRLILNLKIIELRREVYHSIFRLPADAPKDVGAGISTPTVICLTSHILGPRALSRLKNFVITVGNKRRLVFWMKV